MVVKMFFTMMQDSFLIEDTLWMITQPTQVAVYDFDFRRYYECRTPYQRGAHGLGVARIGAIKDYLSFYRACRDRGINLVHHPSDHERCSFLPNWYPLIEGFTPRSQWYDEIPSPTEIEEAFDYPFFLKGARQTSKHKAALSIIHNRSEYEAAIQAYQSDPILHWQQLVCREYIPLRPVLGGAKGKIPASYEFRTFWWRGKLVGEGRYWYEAQEYQWTKMERMNALFIAQQAADAIDCVFLVIDLAQTAEGKWIVIECNDGMESGYAGASPFKIWQSILAIETKEYHEE